MCWSLSHFGANPVAVDEHASRRSQGVYGGERSDLVCALRHQGDENCLVWIRGT